MSVCWKSKVLFECPWEKRTNLPCSLVGIGHIRHNKHGRKQCIIMFSPTVVTVLSSISTSMQQWWITTTSTFWNRPTQENTLINTKFHLITSSSCVIPSFVLGRCVNRCWLNLNLIWFIASFCRYSMTPMSTNAFGSSLNTTSYRSSRYRRLLVPSLWMH